MRRSYPGSPSPGPECGQAAWARHLDPGQKGSLDLPPSVAVGTAQPYAITAFSLLLFPTSNWFPHVSLVFLRASACLGFHGHNFYLHIILIYPGFLFYLKAFLQASRPALVSAMNNWIFLTSFNSGSLHRSLTGQLTPLCTELFMFGHIRAGPGTGVHTEHSWELPRSHMLNMAAQGPWCVWAGQLSLEEDSGQGRHWKSCMLFIKTL